MTESLLSRKPILWKFNGINGSMANPGRAPINRKAAMFEGVVSRNTLIKHNIRVLIKEPQADVMYRIPNYHAGNRKPVILLVANSDTIFPAEASYHIKPGKRFPTSLNPFQNDNG